MIFCTMMLKFLYALSALVFAKGVVGGKRRGPVYNVHSDHFEGDMVFPKGFNIWSYATPPLGSLQDGENGIRGKLGLWVDATIPYELSENINDINKKAITKAILEFSENTCVKWIPRRDDSDYVLIQKGNVKSGCWSNIGMIGGRNTINLAPRCFKKGIVLHEMMHTLGFFHEQSRPDRDDYVNVWLKNVKEERHREFFHTYSVPEIHRLGTEYDCDSIMHYPKYAFAK